MNRCAFAGACRPARRPLVRMALAGVALLAGAAHAQGSPDEPFIVFDRSHPLMPDDGVPMVQVFDSGRVVVTRGPGRTRPGRTELRLGGAELERLRVLAASGASADPPPIAVPRREIVDGREVFTIVHDAVTTSVRVRVAGTDGGLTLAGAPATVRTIEVEGLDVLAEAAAVQPGIDALAELERVLLDVHSRPLEGEGR